jgi:Protein of unknown function (DUF2911)
MRHSLFCTALIPMLAAAQSAVIETPRQSQSAMVSQRIELTDVTIRYSRPVINGRKVWGGMVPFGEVWRAGANENTTIEFSDPVMIDGSRLEKGIYGLHMIPKEESWTVIFSKSSSAWGSYTYSEKEDALRVTVKPQTTNESYDALTYAFEDLQPNSTMAVLHWDKLAVGFKITADREATLTKLREQLRGRAKYTWDGWDDAAQWCLKNNTNLEEALNWSDQSIQYEERFENEMTKAGILKAEHRDEEASALRKHALETGSAVQVYSYGRQMQGEKKKTEAIDAYRATARRFPENWIGLLAKARVAVADGDYTEALKAVEAAQAAAPEQQKAPLTTLKKRIEAKEDINT